MIELEKREQVLRTTAIVVGEGGYAVNYEHLDIRLPEGDNYFQYHHGNIPNNPGVEVTNIALCGMAALQENPNRPGDYMFANHATLINRGTIDIHFADIYRLYLERKAQLEHPEDVRFDTVRCYAMAAGDDSMLINQGVINVYMDQDIDAEVSLYGCALWANAHSFMHNLGEIHFIGNGSYQTYTRGIGSMASHLKCINDGVVTVDMPRSYQTRILHTAGQGGALVNNGKISVKTSGRIMVLGSLCGTLMQNYGKIEVCSLATWLENKVPYHYQFNPLATAFYEHFMANDLQAATTLNAGDIHVHLSGTEASGDDAVAFAYYLHQVGSGPAAIHRLANEGTIKVTQEGPVKYLTADVGVNIQSPGDVPVNVKIGKWNIDGHTDEQLTGLFVSRSARFDLANLELSPNKSSIDKKQMVRQLETSRQAGETFEVKF